jgi:regulator of protease activity HflC (stomatin/prohibitin superfamily)
MIGPDINTEINNLSGPINSEDQIKIPSNFGAQNYQQPFMDQQPQRRTRHTVEIEKSVANGYLMLFIILCSLVVGIILIVVLATGKFEDKWPLMPVIFFLFIFQVICSKGFFTNTPNVAHVITYFGNYLGSVKNVGLFWINPFYTHILIDMKRYIFRSEVIKVNDKTGNPIMVGCIVVWRVKDTAKAYFDVQNYSNYVRVQTETAIRYIGCKYPYEKINKDDICLRSGHGEINDELKRELIERLEPSGIDIVEAYINEMSYAPEIATVMLKRQGAQAIIAAREKIVQGAVSIAGHAVQSLKENNIVELNDDEKSDIVSNLILVLCTEADVRPVVNAGAGALA